MNFYEIGVGIIFSIACVLWLMEWLAYRRVLKRLDLLDQQIVITRRVLDEYEASLEARIDQLERNAFN